MKDKARILAISGICGAVAVVCVLLATLPGVKWFVLMLAVVASIAVVIPLLIDGRNLVYSLLIYLVCALLGVFIGLANIVYVAPIVTFCIPFAIVKVYGETLKVTAKVQKTETLEDPFGQGDDRKVVKMQLDGKPRLNVVVKWVLYYVLLEAGLALTMLATYLLTRPVFDQIYATKWIFWLIVGAAQLAVPLYDLLLRGCLIGTVKALHKVIK